MVIDYIVLRRKFRDKILSNKSSQRDVKMFAKLDEWFNKHGA